MSKSFCSLPWIHLATHPHGGATLCCQSEMEKGLSAAANSDGKDPMTLNDRSLSALINSKTFREVRLSMLKGEQHPACQPCWEREEKGVQSKRLLENKRFPFDFSEAQERTTPDGSITPDIRFAELRLGNTCNIKCVTCNPNSSNTFGKEYEQIRKEPGMSFLRDYSWVTPGMSDWTQDENFWKSLGDNSPQLREVYINGGEPMLINQHVALLEQLVKDGRSKKVRLTYSINMTKLIEKVRPFWNEFAEVHFACSIDDWDTRNFYIRYPSAWEKVTSNFQQLIDWGFNPHVVQTVSALNFHGLDVFYAKWQQKFPGSVIAYNDVFDPPWFSPFVLKPEWRKEILVRLKKNISPRLYTQLSRMYENEKYTPEHWPRLKKHLMAMDNARDNDVREYFPEFERFLNERGEGFRKGV